MSVKMKSTMKDQDMSKRNRGSAGNRGAAAAGRAEPFGVALTPAVALPFEFACAALLLFERRNLEREGVA